MHAQPYRLTTQIEIQALKSLRSLPLQEDFKFRRRFTFSEIVNAQYGLIGLLREREKSTLRRFPLHFKGLKSKELPTKSICKIYCT